MMDRLIGRLCGIPPRTLMLAMAAVLLLVLLEGWLLALRAPWTEYQRIRQAKRTAVAALSDNAAPTDRLQALERELAALERRVAAGSTELSSDQLVLTVVDGFSSLARSHDVTLGGVKAAGARRVFKFDELSFDIQTRGRYQNLVDLLHEVDRGMKPMAVNQFSIRQADATGMLDMDVRLVAFRRVQAVEPTR